MALRKFDRNRLDLLWEFVKTSFKMRYQNSILGVLWVLIKPYSQFFVLYLIMSSGFSLRTTTGDYGIYLLLGIVVFTYFNELVVFGQMALLERAHIILKVNFPRQIAIMSSLISAVVNLGINLVFVLLIMFVRGIPFSVGGVLYFLFVCSIFFVGGLGLSFISSILTIRFRDLKNIVELGMFLLNWGSAVFYDPATFGSKASQIILANPIAIMINQIRAGFGVGSAEINIPLMLMYLFAVISFTLFSWVYFSSAIKRVAEHF